MKPTVAAIIATRNGERFVAETLASALAERPFVDEIVVCDDGSTDRTPQILRSFGTSITVVPGGGRGVSRARNAAVAATRAELLAFLDHDDLFEPGKTARALARFAAEPEVALVYGDAWIIDAQGAVHGRRSDHLRHAEGRVFAALLRGNFIPLETLVVRRAAFEEVLGFDPGLRFIEDWDLCLKIAARHPVARIPEPVARYRVHGGNLSRQRTAMAAEVAEYLAALPGRFPELGVEERAHLAADVPRRFADAAWHALGDADVAAADRYLARAKALAPGFRARRVAALRAAVALLPKALVRSVAEFRRARLLGVKAAVPTRPAARA